MNRLCLMLTMVIIGTTAALAQLRTDTLMLGMEFSFFEHSNRYDPVDEEIADETNLRILASVGTFVSKSVAVGIIGGASLRRREPEYDEIYLKSRSIVLGMFARYSKDLWREELFFIMDGSVFYSRGKQGGGQYDDLKLRAATLAITPGLAYLLNRQWSAELLFRGIGITSHKSDGKFEDIHTTTFDFGIDALQPRLLVRYYFGRRR